MLIDLPGQVERGDQRGQQAREEIRRLVVVVTSTAGAAGHKADHLKLDDLAVPGAPRSAEPSQGGAASIDRRTRTPANRPT